MRIHHDGIRPAINKDKGLHIPYYGNFSHPKSKTIQSSHTTSNLSLHRPLRRTFCHAHIILILFTHTKYILCKINMSAWRSMRENHSIMMAAPASTPSPSNCLRFIFTLSDIFCCMVLHEIKLKSQTTRSLPSPLFFECAHSEWVCVFNKNHNQRNALLVVVVAGEFTQVHWVAAIGQNRKTTSESSPAPHPNGLAASAVLSYRLTSRQTLGWRYRQESSVVQLVWVVVVSSTCIQVVVVVAVLDVVCRTVLWLQTFANHYSE